MFIIMLFLYALCSILFITLFILHLLYDLPGPNDVPLFILYQLPFPYTFPEQFTFERT